MLRKLMIGPAVTGIGYLAGAYYGADAEQSESSHAESFFQRAFAGCFGLGECLFKGFYSEQVHGRRCCTNPVG